MSSSPRQGKIFRWILGVLLVTMGLSTVWAWGRVAQLAEPQPVEAQPVAQALRWLVLGLSLAGTAGLVLGNPQRTAVPVFNR